MSAAVGIFTRAFGVGSGTGQSTLNPLPLREQGAYIGRGRTAGHRVQTADWAWLHEAAEERTSWLSMPGGQDTVRHDYYPHNHVYRVLDSGGAEIYNTEGYRDYPSYAAWSAVYNLGVTRTWMRPDIAPPASVDGYWYLEGGGNDRANYEYQFATPYGSQPTARLRRVDDVRCLFYDLQHCTRRSVVNGGRTYYYNGAASGNNGPACSCTGPWSPSDYPAHASRSDADEMRVTNTSVPSLITLHHEVVAHQDFAVAPAYAVVQLRATQQHGGPVVRNWGRYVATSWTLDAATATVYVDLAACGCDAPGLAAWMDATIGSYVSGDLYTGSAQVVELVYDLFFPADRMFFGWDWTPNAAA